MKEIPKLIFRYPLIGLVMLVSLAQSPAMAQAISLPDYIETYRGIAMQEMRRHGIPASIKLAQAILESGFGNSELAVNANNHFGIKCHGWGGPGYLYDDDARDECFRKYDNPVRSFLDHSQFLLTRPRYAFLFDLNPMDYRAWAHGLRTAGYATNPNYPAMLIRIIEEHNLMRYDAWAMDLKADLPPGIPSNGNGFLVPRQPHEDFEVVETGPRKEMTNNRIRYVRARRGDTPESLARELGMWRWQIVRYNELEDDQMIIPGQIIYLQPKRRRGAVRDHIVREGESMYDISQQYGIQLDHLYRRNNMPAGSQPQSGQRLLLQGRVR